jgi:hypothetical protein
MTGRLTRHGDDIVALQRALAEAQARVAAAKDLEDVRRLSR